MGPDAMTYAASTLSFMLDNSGKMVQEQQGKWGGWRFLGAGAAEEESWRSRSGHRFRVVGAWVRTPWLTPQAPLASLSETWARR